MNLALLLNLQEARKRGDADRVNNNNNNERIALPAKQIKTNEDRKKSTHPGNNRNNLNIMVTDLTSREFGRVDIKSLTRFEGPLGLLFLELISITLYDSLTQIQAIDPTNVADVFNTVISKSDKVSTREPSSYIKTELYLHQKLCDNSRKFYRLVITGEDTHCKQIIKKAYIMSLERALLILFMI
ncbi:hypothetical protein HBI07_116300 [Parastagonospora nodorum]|nr:hypothetical protein HBI07_116300 [Parastagonospora nodorum]